MNKNFFFIIDYKELKNVYRDILFEKFQLISIFRNFVNENNIIIVDDFNKKIKELEKVINLIKINK